MIESKKPARVVSDGAPIVVADSVSLFQTEEANLKNLLKKIKHSIKLTKQFRETFSSTDSDSQEIDRAVAAIREIAGVYIDIKSDRGINSSVSDIAKERVRCANMAKDYKKNAIKRKFVFAFLTKKLHPWLKELYKQKFKYLRELQLDNRRGSFDELSQVDILWSLGRAEKNRACVSHDSGFYAEDSDLSGDDGDGAGAGPARTVSGGSEWMPSPRA